MKTVFLFAVAMLFALSLGSCATDPEDRAFFNTGWRNPIENDRRLEGYYRR